MIAKLRALFSVPVLVLLSSIALGLALFAVALSFPKLPPDLIATRTWKRHYTLYIESSQRVEEVSRRIAALPGIEAVVSRYTSRVSFNTFSGFDAVLIQAIPDRLDLLDPRFDPYLRKVGNLFTIPGKKGTWELLYLRSDADLLSTVLGLRRVLREEELRWRLLEFDAGEKALELVLFLLFCALLFLLQPSPLMRVLLCAGALPWLFLLLWTGYHALLAFFLIYPLWLYLLYFLFRGANAEARTRAVGRFALALLPAFGFLLLGRYVPLAGIMMASAGGVLLIPLLYCLLVFDRLRRAHTPFQPVAILRRFARRGVWLNRERALLLVLAAVVAVGLPVLHLGRAGRAEPAYRLQLPAKRQASGDFSWSTLSALAATAQGRELPNLADYLSHRAYQEALIFGRPYGLPYPGERLLVSTYRRNTSDMRIQKTYRVVKRFEASWFEQALSSSAPGSVARLLVDQERAAEVVVVWGAQPYPVPATALLIVLFLATFFIPGHFHLTPSVLYATRSLTLRRIEHALWL